MITASLSNHRISPRKVRIVADMIRGKKVSVAKTILENASKKAKDPLATLIDSAIANAVHNHKIDIDTLIVSEIRVDKGYTLKRSIPMSRGSAFPIKKKTSHVMITLAPAPVRVVKGTKKAAKAAKLAAAAASTPTTK